MKVCLNGILMTQDCEFGCNAATGKCNICKPDSVICSSSTSMAKCIGSSWEEISCAKGEFCDEKYIHKYQHCFECHPDAPDTCDASKDTEWGTRLEVCNSDAADTAKFGTKKIVECTDGKKCPFGGTKCETFNEDICSGNANKKVPGLCGCDVEDSVENTSDDDGDGIINCLDHCRNNPGVQYENGTCGCDKVVAHYLDKTGQRQEICAYPIFNAKDLKSYQEKWNSESISKDSAFVLKADIELNEVVSDTSEWIPFIHFSGIFISDENQLHEIRYTQKTSKESKIAKLKTAGIFEDVHDAIFQNIALNFDLQATAATAGSLAAVSENSFFKSIEFRGSSIESFLDNKSVTGGLVGYDTASTFQSISITGADIICKGTCGGVMGETTSSDISNVQIDVLSSNNIESSTVGGMIGKYHIFSEVTNDIPFMISNIAIHYFATQSKGTIWGGLIGIIDASAVSDKPNYRDLQINNIEINSGIFGTESSNSAFREVSGGMIGVIDSISTRNITISDVKISSLLNGKSTLGGVIGLYKRSLISPLPQSPSLTSLSLNHIKGNFILNNQTTPAGGVMGELNLHPIGSKEFSLDIFQSDFRVYDTVSTPESWKLGAVIGNIDLNTDSSHRAEITLDALTTSLTKTGALKHAGGLFGLEKITVAEFIAPKITLLNIASTVNIADQSKTPQPIGGLIGEQSISGPVYHSIFNTYSTGTIQSQNAQKTGGLLGYLTATDNVTIQNVVDNTYSRVSVNDKYPLVGTTETNFNGIAYYRTQNTDVISNQGKVNKCEDEEFIGNLTCTKEGIDYFDHFSTHFRSYFVNSDKQYRTFEAPPSSQELSLVDALNHATPLNHANYMKWKTETDSITLEQYPVLILTKEE